MTCVTLPIINKPIIIRLLFKINHHNNHKTRRFKNAGFFGGSISLRILPVLPCHSSGNSQSAAGGQCIFAGQAAAFAGFC